MPVKEKAEAIAQTLLDGFNTHYRLFRATSGQAKARFEAADWHAQQQAQRDRIAFYDQRVGETVALLESAHQASAQPMTVWAQAKLLYIGLLTQHLQPELAETFFNSVTCKILHRSYFHNDFLFVRPAASTDYIENDEPAATPTYRVYYPKPSSLAQNIERVINNFQLKTHFAHLDSDAQQVAQVMLAALREAEPTPSTVLATESGVLETDDLTVKAVVWRDNAQIQVLASLFYRNKAAYVVGKLVNGHIELPFALPILHSEHGLRIDAALIGASHLLKIFSFARAYFMVDMAVPSATVQFLRNLMPSKPRAELYNAIGLQKHGKTVFYRDVLYHLRHSTDRFRIAPGIKGMVMLVFDLPSFPYVFKLIKDFYPAAKDTTREQIKAKYLLVKQHDRVGRMADTLEYSDVAFPKERFTRELVEEIRQFCPSLLEEDGQDYVLKHLYIERRMVPLNLYLQAASPAQVEAVVIEYGNAIKDLVAANIFPGDMLWKNFGVTRHDKVVFYDYDEIEYLTDCQFRKVPQARNEEDEMSGEVWYAVKKNDIFPETFAPFLLGNPVIKAAYMKHHADLLDPQFWQHHQTLIRMGKVPSVYPYEQSLRFKH